MRNGRGVSLYTGEYLAYTHRVDIDIFSDMISKFVEIDKQCFNTDKNVILGLIYQPPDGDVVQFTSLISGTLEKIKMEKIFFLAIMTWNYSMLTNSTRRRNSWKACFHINKPTRDCGHTAYLIDNTYCNQVSLESALSALFHTDVSDHHQYFILKINMQMRRNQTE